MSQKYKDLYRGYLIDHHSPDPPIQRLDRLDVSEWEESLKRARVNCMLKVAYPHEIDLSMTGQVVELPPVDIHTIVSVEA